MLQLCTLVLHSITTVLHFSNTAYIQTMATIHLNLSTKHVLPSPHSPSCGYTTVTSYY